MELIRTNKVIKHAKGGRNNKWGISEDAKEAVWATWTGAVWTVHVLMCYRKKPTLKPAQ